MPFDKQTYKDQYNREHYEQITLRVPIGTRARIAEAAAERGLSTNQYIVSLVEADAIKEG